MRAADDHNLLRPALHRPRAAQIRGQRLAKHLEAGGGAAVAEHLRPDPAQVPPDQSRPDPIGEQIDVWSSAREIDGAGNVRRAGRHRRQALHESRQPRRGPAAHGSTKRGPRMSIRQFARDERARPAPPIQVALGDELVVGGGDSRSRYVQARRQLARGWHPLSGREPAGEDPAAPLLVDLTVERGRTAAIDHERGGQVDWSNVSKVALVRQPLCR